MTEAPLKLMLVAHHCESSMDTEIVVVRMRIVNTLVQVSWPDRQRKLAHAFLVDGLIFTNHCPGANRQAFGETASVFCCIHPIAVARRKVLALLVLFHGIRKIRGTILDRVLGCERDQTATVSQQPRELDSRLLRQHMHARQHFLEPRGDQLCASFRHISTRVLVLDEILRIRRKQAINASESHIQLVKLCTAVRQRHDLLSNLFRESLLSSASFVFLLSIVGRLRKRVGLTAQPINCERGKRSYKNTSSGPNGSDGVPPDHTVIYTQLVASKDAIPFAHSLNPLWTGGHSATRRDTISQPTTLANVKPPRDRRTRLRPDTEHKDCTHG